MLVCLSVLVYKRGTFIVFATKSLFDFVNDNKVAGVFDKALTSTKYFCMRSRYFYRV